MLSMLPLCLAVVVPVSKSFLQLFQKSVQSPHSAVMGIDHGGGQGDKSPRIWSGGR